MIHRYHIMIPKSINPKNSIGFFEILQYFITIFRLFRNYKVYHNMIHRYHIMIPKSINPKNSIGFFEILQYFITIFRLFRNNKSVSYYDTSVSYYDTEKYKFKELNMFL